MKSSSFSYKNLMSGKHLYMKFDTAPEKGVLWEGMSRETLFDLYCSVWGSYYVSHFTNREFPSQSGLWFVLSKESLAFLLHW